MRDDMSNREHPLRKWIFAVLLAVVMFLVGAANAVLAQSPALDTFEARVVGVTDGDTLKVIHPDPRNPTLTLSHRIRLAEIDTPERRQPFGSAAKQALSELVFNKMVRVVQTDIDRYGRLVAHVYVDQMWVNASMVRGGYAWVYRRYARSPELLRIEEAARVRGVGLWSLPEAHRVPPWEWRRKTK